VPPIALALILGATVFHTTWNLVLKSESRRLEAALLALVGAVLLSAPALLFHPLAEVSLQAWALVLLSGAFETAYLVALTAAYRIGDLSLVYPIARGTAPLMVTPLAMLVLGERLSPSGLVGVALIVAGIFGMHPGALRSATGARPAVGLAALSGLMIAGYSLVNKVGVGTMPVLLWAFLVQSVDAVLLLIVLEVRGGISWPRAGAPRWRAFAIGALMLGAYLAILTALSLAPVSYVVAGREVSIVVTALAGALLLRERHSGRRIAGAVVIFAGLVVLALSR
jgi:drug/metabolite transporter (DMT)-like permease